MAVRKKDMKRTERRKLRVRSRLKNNTSLKRISVFRSLNNIYAQIIDDVTHATVVSCSSLEMKDIKGDKKVVAHAIGKELAKRAQEKGIVSAVFDRGACLYHGRVKSLADGLREGGLGI